LLKFEKEKVCRVEEREKEERLKHTKEGREEEH